MVNIYFHIFKCKQSAKTFSQFWREIYLSAVSNDITQCVYHRHGYGSFYLVPTLPASRSGNTRPADWGKLPMQQNSLYTKHPGNSVQ